MASQLSSLFRKFWRLISSIKTGVILLIIVVIVSAAGTVILQRPMTEGDEMQRAYSPRVKPDCCAPITTQCSAVAGRELSMGCLRVKFFTSCPHDRCAGCPSRATPILLVYYNCALQRSPGSAAF